MSAIEKKSTGIVRGAARAVEAGFTLLEIMVVLAIIALLAGGVGAAVFKQFKKAQVSTARLRVKAARDATARRGADNHRPRAHSTTQQTRFSGHSPWTSVRLKHGPHP